jgi:hypothetical protein
VELAVHGFLPVVIVVEALQASFDYPQFDIKIVLKKRLHRHCEPFLKVFEVEKGVPISSLWGFPRLSSLKAFPKPTDDRF